MHGAAEAMSLNYEMAMDVLPFATWTHILGTYGRVILVYFSYSKPEICKLYLHYEMFAMIVDLLIVTQSQADTVQYITLLKMTILFYNFYYDFIPSAIAVFTF